MAVNLLEDTIRKNRHRIGQWKEEGDTFRCCVNSQPGIQKSDHLLGNVRSGQDLISLIDEKSGKKLVDEVKCSYCAENEYVINALIYEMLI